MRATPSWFLPTSTCEKQSNKCITHDTPQSKTRKTYQRKQVFNLIVGLVECMLDVATDFPSAVLHDEVQEGFEVPPDADKLRGKCKDVRIGKLRTSGG